MSPPPQSGGLFRLPAPPSLSIVDDMKPLKSAVWIPLFDELADARVVATLAASAEEAGWDGLFVWDHVRWRHPVRAVADPWVALTAAAMATETLRIGPMVTPLARRRPADARGRSGQRSVRRGVHPLRR